MALDWKRVVAVVDESHPSFRAEDEEVEYRLRADETGAYRVHVIQRGKEHVLRYPKRYREGRRVSGDEIVGDLGTVKAAAERHAHERRALSGDWTPDEQPHKVVVVHDVESDLTAHFIIAATLDPIHETYMHLLKDAELPAVDNPVVAKWTGLREDVFPGFQHFKAAVDAGRFVIEVHEHPDLASAEEHSERLGGWRWFGFNEEGDDGDDGET
jgi:hypothetical protein